MTLKRVGLRITEFADAAGISRSKAYEAVASGEIPVVEIAGVRRVPAGWVAQKFGLPVDGEQSDVPEVQA